MSSHTYLQVRIDHATGAHLLELVHPEDGVNYTTATLTLGKWDAVNDDRYESLVTVAEDVFANGNSVSLSDAGGNLSIIGSAYAAARTDAAGSEYYLVLMPFDETNQSLILAEQEYTPTSLEYWNDANNSDTPMVSLVYDEYSFEPVAAYTGADLMMRVDDTLYLVTENIFEGSLDVQQSAIEAGITAAFTANNIVGKNIEDVDLVLVGNHQDTLHWVLYDEANDTQTNTVSETVLAYNDQGDQDANNDTLMIVRSTADAARNFTAADLMAKNSDNSLTLIKENAFATNDEVLESDLNSWLVTAYGDANSVPEFVDLVLVEDKDAPTPNILVELMDDNEGNEVSGGSGVVTHLRYDDPDTKVNLILEIASDDTTTNVATADLMVRYTTDNWASEDLALFQGNFFSDAIVNGSVYQKATPTDPVLFSGHDANNPDHQYEWVLVEAHDAATPVIVAEFLPPPPPPPEHTYIGFTNGADGAAGNADDMFSLVRSTIDANKDFKTADLVVVKTVENADNTFTTTYHDLISNIFATADEVSASTVDTAVDMLLENADHYDFLLVEDASIDSADWSVMVGHDHSKEVTGLRYDDDATQTLDDDTLTLEIATLDTTAYAMADLVVRVNNDDGSSKYALVKDAAFDGSQTLNYSDIENSLITALTGLGHTNPDPSIMDIDFVLVADASSLASDTTGADLDILVEEYSNQGDNGGGLDTGGIDSPFELVEVQDERYGDIITFGIRVKDNKDGTTESIDLASASFQIDWEEGEYEYWGGFENVNATPTNDTAANVNLGLTLNSAGEDDTRINLETFGFGDTAPITYSEGDLVATFMLERTDQSANVTNDIYLTKSNFSEADDDTTTDVDESLVDILTKPQTFTFDYDQDTINIEMITASGEEVPDATLYVSSDTVTDGLSLVAVEQMGRLVKYQLVLNVSVPMTMDALATIDTNQSVDIYGAHIFTDSLMDITILEDGAGAASVSAAVINATDGTGTAVTVGDAADGYTGTEFFDQVDAAMSLLEDSDDTSLLEAIDVTDHLHIDVAGLADLTNEGTDGRYVLAEFVAYTDGSISFSDNWAIDEGITINQIEVVGADLGIKTFEVSDGSDVVLLGESVYLNPGLNIDAISATDALGALKIASGDTGYSQSQIIAADFDADGVVEAMDAYNILHYAVFGEGSEDEVPTWVYIDDIDSGTATAEAVTYDNNIDLFIGDVTDIDATGVLRGDVSENYTEIPDGYNTLDYYLGAFTEAMGDLGTDLETAPSYVA